jgi:NAD(P)-dependent dehydrogenase (short-subunit alcohol dehydrogenase family)
MRAEGAVVVIGDIDPTTGKAVADELNVTFVQVDVADEDAVNNLFDTAFKVHGGVDIAFNNAGISPPDDDLIENTELPAWRRSRTSTSKRVPVLPRRARHMVPRKRGSIINTASFVAVMGSATSQISRVPRRRARDIRNSVCSSPAGHPGQRAVPGPGEHPAAAGTVRQGSRMRRAGWCTSRWAPSPNRRLAARWRSWRPTTRRSSPVRRSWSTAASARPT